MDQPEPGARSTSVGELEASVLATSWESGELATPDGARAHSGTGRGSSPGHHPPLFRRIQELSDRVHPSFAAAALPTLAAHLIAIAAAVGTSRLVV